MTMVSDALRSRNLNDDEFEKIRSMVYDSCGINLHQGKKELVQARLNKRLRFLGLHVFKDYITYVQSEESGREFSTMIDCLTTNKTEFFREPSHFDFLKSTVLPAAKKQHKLRVWSAGCSSGEEPYTIAMVLKEYEDAQWEDIRILATDLSSDILYRARKGIYPKETLKNVPPMLRDKYFGFVRNQPGLFKAGALLRSMISFARLNLMDEWPMRGPFDMIFCRNVMIYFDKPTQKKLIDRYYEIIRPGGYLFVGHSESLAGLTHSFHYIQPAVYRK